MNRSLVEKAFGFSVCLVVSEIDINPRGVLKGGGGGGPLWDWAATGLCALALQVDAQCSKRRFSATWNVWSGLHSDSYHFILANHSQQQDAL